MGEKLRAAMSTLRQAPAALAGLARTRGPQKAVLVLAGVVVLLIGVVAWFVVVRSDDSSVDEAEVADPPSTTQAPAEPTTTDTTVPETTTTTSPWTEEEQEVIDAYEAAVDAAIAAEADPNGEHDLEATHTGLALERREVEVEVLALNEAVREFPRGSLYEREIIDVSFGDNPEIADVHVCTITDQQEIADRTGAVMNRTEEPRTVEDHNQMEFTNGSWKMADHETIGQREGVAGCALD